MALRRAGKGYVLGVNSNRPFHSWDKPFRVSGTAASIASSLPATAWTRLSAGEGTKGAKLYDWAISISPISTRRRLPMNGPALRMGLRHPEPLKPGSGSGRAAF